MKTNKLFVSLGTTAGVVLVLGIIIAANVIFGQIRAFRADLTDEKLYTLADGTRHMLSELERDVTLKFYFSRSAESVPIPIKQYAQRIRDLLSEYATHGRGKVELEVLDPQPDSDEREWAQKYGLQAQGLGILGGEQFFLGLAAVSGTREGSIPFLAPGAEPQLEYLVTRLIYEVSRTTRPVIGVMSPLPVMGGPAMPYGPQQPPRQKWAFVSEMENLYEIRTVAPSSTEIEEDIETLMVVHPKELSDETLFAIDQFLLRGGRLMVFMDAMCMTEQETQPQPNQFGAFGNASDLNKLTEAWGLELVTGKIVGDKLAATEISRGAGGAPERSIAWLSLRAGHINREEVATSSLEFLMMPFAGALRGEPAEGLELTKLITSSEDAGMLDSFRAMGDASGMLEGLERDSNLMLAVRLQGNFKTAFPDGLPTSDEDEEETEGEGEEKAPDHLTESDGQGAVLLVTDVDMLYDRFSMARRQFLGHVFFQPLNDNINFALNMAEQFAGSEALIGLRGRGTYERPFEKVIELQKAAQEEWQIEEERLQAEQQRVQERISELQEFKEGDQRLSLSPAQREEVKKFNDQLFKTNQQLKEVRKNLRHDIEMLGLKLKVLNIAAVPLLVAGYGIFRGLRRRKRAAAGS